MRVYLLVLLLLAGCATQQAVTLYPRGPGLRGAGVFDHVHQVLTVELDGQRYQGTPVTQTATSGYSLFGPQSTTTTNQEAALLLGEAGQVRCEFAWGPMKQTANGTCVDRNNVVYDMQIRNP